jgi:hypothetical protein
MQYRSWMWIESDYSWNSVRSTRALNHRAHDQLVAQMQTIEHAKSQNGWTLNFGVVSSVK